MPAEFLGNLPKNLTTHLTHKLCAVLPKRNTKTKNHIARTKVSILQALCPFSIGEEENPMILHNATVDTILERRSVRSYAPQQITPDELETILEAGRSAPSGMNQQSAIAVAVQSKAELAQLVELAKAAAHQDHNPFYDAPTVILVFAKMTNLAPMEDGCTAI